MRKKHKYVVTCLNCDIRSNVQGMLIGETVQSHLDLEPNHKVGVVKVMTS